jgi:hypothetical protein
MGFYQDNLRQCDDPLLNGNDSCVTIFCFFLVVEDLKMGGKTFFFFQLRQTIRLHVELLSQFGSFIHCYKNKI